MDYYDRVLTMHLALHAPSPNSRHKTTEDYAALLAEDPLLPPPRGGKVPRQDHASRSPPLSRLAASTAPKPIAPGPRHMSMWRRTFPRQTYPADPPPPTPRQLLTEHGPASDNSLRLDLTPVGNVTVGRLRLPQPFFPGYMPIVGEGQ
jgi:hypothetical protein